MPVLEEVPSAPICVCGSFIEGHSLEYLSSPQAVMNCPCSSSPWDSIKRDRTHLDAPLHPGTKTEVGFVWAFCMMHWGRSASPVPVGKDRFVALSPHGATTGKCHVGGRLKVQLEMVRRFLG